MGVSDPAGQASQLVDAGLDCLICHSESYHPGEAIFQLAGTVYLRPTDRQGLQGAEVHIVDAQGRDIRLAESRVEGYRNFATKLWNAARYGEMNDCRPDPAFDPAACRLTVNRWIIAAAADAAREVTAALDTFKFNEAAGALYHFAWGTFCDWYLEFTKPILNGDDAEAAAETRAATAWVFDQILKLLHPFMPFISEELWASLSENRASMLILESWPETGDALAAPDAAAEMDWVVRLISEIRAVRAEMNVPAGARLDLAIRDLAMDKQPWLSANEAQIKTLARIDLDQERGRLAKEIGKTAGEIGKLEKKLGNAGFLAKAPEDVVEENRRRLAEAEAQKSKLEAALTRISAA